MRAIATQSSPNLVTTPDCRGLRPRNDTLFINRPRGDVFSIYRPRGDNLFIGQPRNNNLFIVRHHRHCNPSPSLRAVATQSSPNLVTTPDCRGLRPRNDTLIINRPRNDTLFINRPRGDVFSIYRPRGDNLFIGQPRNNNLFIVRHHRHCNPSPSLRAVATQSSPNLVITPDCRGLRPRNDRLNLDSSYGLRGNCASLSG